MDTMFSDEEREQIKEAYLAQTEEGLTNMELALLQLESCPDNEEAINLIFRTCHTLKGDSATLGFSTPAAFSHILEDLLVKIRSGEIGILPELTTLLLESVDTLRALVQDATEGIETDTESYATLANQLQDWARTDHEIHTEELQESVNASAKRSASKAISGEHDEGNHQNQTLRIRVDTLDRLLNLTGEIAIGRSFVEQMLTQDSRNVNQDLVEAFHALDPLYTELQEEVMKVRMVPIGPLFRHYLRTVRDLGVENEKQVRLQITGEDAELDTTVIEHLRGCLGHMVRNAVAHGIERPEIREQNGKDPCGQITLAARHEGSSILVEVQDDGAGLDYERILERARELGLLNNSETPSQQQLAQVIFEPGFTTTEDTTLSSGRGVGMDVVRRNIESLGGTVQIFSETGQGSTIRMRLPLTLAIVDGFTVGVGSDRYVIPLSSVIECLDLVEEDQTPMTGMINLRGKPLPYVRLRKILGSPGKPPERESIVVTYHHGEIAGIVVDHLYGESQIVIKPLDRLFQSLPGIAGSTILGDGRVALILDVPALLGSSTGWNGDAIRENELFKLHEGNRDANVDALQ